jgi:very-short-patch-repair endonuclease
VIDQARARVGQWKLSLVDSPLLLDVDEASSLALPGVEPEALVASLVGGAAFAFEAGVDSSVATGWLRIELPTPELERRLARMRRAARAELSETGTHTLWVALGALVWTDDETTRRAPLALLPVELERASGGGMRLVALEGAALRVNDVLVEKLRETFDVVVPPVDGQVELAALFEMARGIAVTRPGWSVEPSVRLGLYSLSRVTLARDVAAVEAALVETPVVQQLAGALGAFAQPSIAAAEAVTRPRGTADVLAPLDADAGQLAAVAAAAAGATFVLSGAPGTGKSQTIANLIAHCASAGKTVLFVGPTRTTLDVVLQRLAAVGLGELCLPLYAPEATRGAALAQLGRVLERAFRPAAGTLSDDARLVELRTALDAHVSALHKVGPFGRSLHDVIGRLVELRTMPRAGLAERDAVGLDRATYERRRVAVEELAAASIPVEPVAAHPWRASTLEPVAFGSAFDGRQRATVALDEMVEAVAALATAVAEVVGLVPGLVTRTRPQLAALGALATVAAATPRPGAELLTNIRGGRTDEIAERVALIRAKGNGTLEVPRDPLAFLALASKHRALAEEVAEKFTDAVDELDAPALWGQLRKWTNSMGPLRYVALRTVRATVKAAAVPGELASDEAMIAALEATIAERACRAALTAAAEPAKRWFGELGGDPLMLDLAKVDAAVSWAGELRKAFDAVDVAGGEPGRAAAWRALVAQVAATPASADATGEPVAFARLASAVARWSPALAALASAVGIDAAVLGAGDDHVQALRERVEAMRGAVDSLQAWVTFHAARHAALAAGVGPAVTAIERGDLGAEELAPAWECATLFAWIEAELAEAPALAQFHGAAHHAHVSAFADLDRGALALARARALVRFAERVPKPVIDPNAKDGGGEVGLLLAEVRRARQPAATPAPLRPLLAQLPTLLPRLAPCVVATPGALAELLDPSLPAFDVVVIDDAHLLAVAPALGALARGRAAVIAGDPWADDRRTESSLFAAALDAHLPQLELTWHYRSKHEDLIAFANARLATSQLQILPAAVSASELGVSARKVETERAEAETIVAEVVVRLRDPMQRARSIGIVAVSPAQRELIEDLFDQVRAADPALDAAFDPPADTAGTSEPVFIRDLATLRAEERDVVFLSAALGADETLDERRLLLATTTAREHLIVVTSKQADEATGTLGELIAFARARGGSARPADDTPPASPITAAIARALTERGWLVRHQVGCGPFMLDLAVVDPNDSARYVLAIEHDGAAYASAATARDRDRLRPQVLAQLGWRLHRIWGLDWWADPEREIQRAHGAIVAAVAASRQRRSPMSVAPVTRSRTPRPSAPLAAGSAPVARPRANTPTEPVRVAPQFAAGSGPTASVPLPAYDKPTTPIRVARGAIAIGPYNAAAIPAGRRTPDDLFAPRHQAELGKVVEQVLAAEAPMHVDLLARRVGGYFGIGRVTQRVGDQIRQVLLGRGKLGDEDNIVWRMDQDPNSVPAVRVAGHGGAGRREIDQVPLSELASAARIVVERAHGIATADLIRDSARLLGFARITDAVIARVTVGVQLAIARELIRISDGKALMPVA